MSGMPQEKVAETAVVIRMKALANYICKLESEEIFALLDVLFPNMSEDDKEDIHDTIQCSLDGPIDPEECLTAEEFFAQLETEDGATE